MVALVFSLLLGASCKMRDAVGSQQQEDARRTVELVSLDACPFPRGRSTPIQLFVAFDRHGMASRVEVGGDMEGPLADCVVATLKDTLLAPGEYEGETEITRGGRSIAAPQHAPSA
ncbi:MAG: hypothetical protein Q8M65_02170 [Rhodoglobus sp.]|nr:hypothetical protein [Rhodoglobus sp.]